MNLTFFCVKNLPTIDIVELFLVCGRISLALEQIHHRKTEKILLRTKRRQWIVVDGRLRLLSLHKMRIVLLEGCVEIHEGRNRRRTSVKDRILRKKPRKKEIVENFD